MKSLVKCLICGAVFEEGISVCPVCGVLSDQFVPVTVSTTAFRRDTTERFLILGGGTAALSAATAIRERNQTCSIVIVTEEAVPPYNRPMLTKAMGGDASAIAIHDEAWYRDRDIVVLTDRRVVALLPQDRQVMLEGDFRLAYDQCVYALGARCFIPPIPGASLPEVFSIRSQSDVARVLSAISKGKRTAVVIGGGVLGLEAAWALTQQGVSVTVLERSDRIMCRQLDQEASLLLTAAAEKAGVRILAGVETERIEGETHVEGIRLTNGNSVPAELVIIASGVRPNLELGKVAGASAIRALIVNEHMETSLPNVYACGDCAEINSVNAAIWPVATEMGRIAGANAAGEPISYKPVSLAITFTGMNTALYADGDTGQTPGKSYRSEVTRDDSACTLEKCFFEGDHLCGVILLGDIRKAAHYDGLMR